MKSVFFCPNCAKIAEQIDFLCFLYELSPTMKISALLSTLILLGCLLLAPISTNAQNLCGTTIPQNYEDKVTALLANSNGFRSAATTRLDRKLSITAWLINQPGGLPPNDLIPDIDAAIDSLNMVFEPIGLEFEICEYTTIPNYNFNTFNQASFEEEMLAVYYQPNTINMYFPDEILPATGGMVAGLAYMPGDGAPDAIYIATPDTDNDGIGETSYKTIAHEMGHYFGLFHTHETDFGDELAGIMPSENCEEAGDLICDTEADPYEDDIPFDEETCNLTVNLTDANGEWYVPPTNNLMSYYPESCRCIFTADQYNWMANVYLSERTYLW